MSEVLHPEEAVTTVLLVRHGHTPATDSGKIYSDPDAELTERGIEQIRELAEWIPQLKPTAVLCGPALRVRSSAEIIAKPLGLPIKTDDGLHYWRVGDWDGKTYLEVKKNEPEIYKKWTADPVRNAPPGGESIADVCHRTQTTLDKIRTNYEGQTVAVVTHAEIIRAALVYALGMPLDNYWRVFVPTGSVSRIDLSANFATVHYMSFRPELMAAAKV